MATLLIVDDEPQVLRLVASVLAKNGFSVLTAASASEAISVWRTHSSGVDLLVTDVAMPGMNGPELVEQLRAQDPDLPVILMSGGCDASLLRSSRLTQVLRKPFLIADLLHLVQTALRAGLIARRPQDGQYAMAARTARTQH